eukprot:1346673-Amorphochlora_amoeboformis.AAC.1
MTINLVQEHDNMHAHPTGRLADGITCRRRCQTRNRELESHDPAYLPPDFLPSLYRRRGGG